MVQNNAQMKRGNHQLTWNARIYLLKMQAENYVESKKIVVVK